MPIPLLLRADDVIERQSLNVGVWHIATFRAKAAFGAKRI